MTGIRTRVLAWTLGVCAIALILVSWVLAALSGDAPWFDLVSSGVLLVLPLVGALVASRHPGNAIGWLFLGAGLLMAAAGASYAYAVLAHADGRSLPGEVASAWLTSWVFLPAIFGVPPLLFLLFPDGRPTSRRWGAVVWLTGLSLTAMSLGAALRPGPLADAPVAGVENPIGVPGPIAFTLENIGWTTALLCLVLSTVSLLRRYRRSRGDERLQMRWFTWSAMVFLTGFVISVALFLTPLAAVGQLVVVIGFTTIPLAAGAAILRYRLYDIDLVIKRTLVYGSLTAALVATYFVLVLTLQTLLRPVAGDSELAVAASTLAVAALFRPLRAAIQGGVDRRFFRARYDAARTLEELTQRLRDEVDLDSLGLEVRSAVQGTMQPTHVSLWLRRTT